RIPRGPAAGTVREGGSVRPSAGPAVAGPDGGRRSRRRARAAANPGRTGVASAGPGPARQAHRGQRAGRRVTVRPLRLLGDPVLRTPCDPVVRFDDALARLVGDLLDTVAEPGRAGLAANQIGSGLAVFSYNVDGELGYVI